MLKHFSQRNRTTWLLVGILSLGLLVRLVHLWSISATAFPKIPLVFAQSDMYAFWQWAQTILAGDWLGWDTYHPYFEWMRKLDPPERWYRGYGGKEVYHQAPLYPYFLASLLAFKNSPVFILSVQTLFGSLQPLIMFLLARRLFNSRVALAAAALTALYGPFIFYQTSLLRDWIPPMLEPLVLILILRSREQGRTGDWLATGFVIGLGALTKETTLAISAVASTWVIFQHRPAWREVIRPVGLLCAGFLLCMSPLIARNVAVGAPPFAVSGQGAGNIIVGFVDDMNPVGFEVPSEKAVAIGRHSEGKLLPAVREILLSYGSDYWRLVRHAWLKIRSLVDPFEVPNNTSYYYGIELSPLLAFTANYSLVFPLAIAGFVLLITERRRQALLYSYLITSVAIQMLTLTTARFRLSLLPVLILGAAFFVVEVSSMMAQKKAARAFAFLSIAAVVSMVQQFLVPLPPREGFPRATEYLQSSQVYASEGRLVEAIAEMTRLRRQTTRLPPEGSLVLGDYYVQRVSELLKSGDQKAALRNLQLAQSAYEEVAHLRLSYPLYNLGLMYSKLGKREKAKEFLRRSSELESEAAESDEVTPLSSR